MTDSSPQQTSTEPLQILIVEDNPGDVRLLREALKSTTCETTLDVIRDGDDAVFSLTQQSKDATLPDLVLLDLNLPGRDGCEVLKAVRADSHLSSLPVIVLTSSDATADVAKCYSADANAYLTKPSDPAKFSTLMEKVERFWFDQVQLPPASA